MKQWAVFFGLLLLLHVAWFFVWVILWQNLRRSPSLILVLVIPYLIGLFILFVLFFRRLGDATEPPEYREAKANGLAATAKVLEIRQTRWHTKRRINFRLQTTPRHWEYEIRLKISQPGMPDYEAETAAYLSGKDVPKKGEIIAIKVHPQRPEVVVLA